MKKYGAGFLILAALATTGGSSRAAISTASKRPSQGAPLVATTHSLPAARAGQAYLWTLTATGGSGTHDCVPKALGVGTIALTANCRLTGIAPVVDSKSVTGPFFFEMRDHSSPPKTVEFGPLNLTTLAPPVPAGWQLVKSVDGVASTLPIINITIKDPSRISVRLIGATNGMPWSVDEACDDEAGNLTYNVLLNYRKVGPYTVVRQVEDSCGLTILVNSLSEKKIGVQIIDQKHAAPPTPHPTPTTTPTPQPTTSSAYPYDGTWTGTLSGTMTFTAVTDPNSGDVVGQTIPVTSNIYATVDHGTLTTFVGYTTGDPGSVPGDWGGQVWDLAGTPSIPSGGLLTGLVIAQLELNDTHHSDFNTSDCASFSMQFQSTQATATVSCQGGFDEYGSSVNYTGAINITLAKPGG